MQKRKIHKSYISNSINHSGKFHIAINRKHHPGLHEKMGRFIYCLFLKLDFSYDKHDVYQTITWKEKSLLFSLKFLHSIFYLFIPQCVDQRIQHGCHN